MPPAPFVVALAILASACASVEAESPPVASTPAAPSAEPLMVVGPGRHEGEVVSGGRLRRFVLHVPEDLPAPAPLVVVFHGFAGDPERVESLSGMTEIAEREGFLVVYPAARGVLPAWATDAGAHADTDVRFVRDLVEAVSEAVPVDPGRVYAAGMSNGGGMVGRLACDAADLVAAVASVAGAHTVGECRPSGPVSVIAFHGTGDPIVPYRGFAALGLPPVAEWAADWAARSGCLPEPSLERIAGDVETRAWGGCEGGAEVVLYTIEGGRHGWPGSDRALSVLDSTMSIRASDLIWEFFSRHGRS